MKILVVDDSHNNRVAAKALELDHEVVISDWYPSSWFPKALDRGSEKQFDVALLDLLMPGKNDNGVWSQELPLGIFHALRLAREGVKMIAVYSDGNHHDSPLVRALEDVAGDQNCYALDFKCPEPLAVNGAKLFCFTGGAVEEVVADELATKFPDYAGLDFKADINGGKVRFKNWKQILAVILAHGSETKSTAQ